MTEPSETIASHGRSIVVWDVPNTVDCGGSFRVTVGVKCAESCAPDGWEVEIRDHEQTPIARTGVGPAAWPETAGLYYATVTLRAPPEPGLYRWSAAVESSAAGEAPRPRAGDAPAALDADAAGGTTAAAGHAAAAAAFNVRSVAAAAHRLRVIAVERQSQTPVAGLRVVVHPYRTTTDAAGRAELALPAGKYRVFVSGGGFIPFRSDGELTEDVTLRAELDPDLPPSDAEIWS